MADDEVTNRMPDFSNHHHQIGDNLRFLFNNLGIAELFERVDALDGKGAGPEPVEFNPTNNPMVQPNLEGVGTLSGGPNHENVGTLDVLEPERMQKLRDDEAKAKEEEKKATSSSSTGRSSTAKK